MRYVRLTLSPAEGCFHPVESELLGTGGIDRTKLLHVRLLEDDSLLGLYTGEGDRTTIAETLTAHEAVRHHDVFEIEGLVYAYLHLDPGEPAVELLSIVEEYRLMLDTPLTFTDDGLTMTVLGESGIERAAIEAIPDSIDVEIHRLGEYTPEADGLLSELTERQREVLEAAVAAGYYAVPREATHEDVAEVVGCAPSTASEHLRRAESRIVTALIGTP